MWVTLELVSSSTMRRNLQMFSHIMLPKSECDRYYCNGEMEAQSR